MRVNTKWYACGADGRAAGGRAVYGHVITKFSGMGRFTYPWCSAGALRAPELRYKTPLLQLYDTCAVRYRTFTHVVMLALLLLQNNETTAMLVFQTNPMGLELFSFENFFFC